MLCQANRIIIAIQNVHPKSDYPTLDEIRKKEILTATYSVLPERNLQVNQDKTEHTVIKWGGKEEWRTVRKLGSLLGDKENIAHRKQLAITGMNKFSDIWIRKDKISLNKRLRLYKQLVKPLLLYNCATWGLKNSDTASLDSFHRQQLRRVLGIKWPHRISNANLYKKTNEHPISLFILRQRWELLGHILHSDPPSPAHQSMCFYFEPMSATGFRGRPRTTISTTIDSDLKLAALQNTSHSENLIVSQISMLLAISPRTEPNGTIWVNL